MNYNNLIFSNKYWERVTLDVSDWINNDLSKYSVKCKDRFQTVNHPLVKSGYAFWINNNQLCIGYRLKDNANIFRPVINYTNYSFKQELKKRFI